MTAPTCLKGHPLVKDHRYTKLDVWQCKPCNYTMQTEPGAFRDPEASRERVCGCGCEQTFQAAYRHPDQQYKNTAHRMRAYRKRQQEAKT